MGKADVVMSVGKYCKTFPGLGRVPISSLELIPVPLSQSLSENREAETLQYA